VGLVVILPLILVTVAAIIIVMLASFVIALFVMSPLMLIWFYLFVTTLVFIPLEKLWVCLGVGAGVVDTDEYKWRLTRWMLIISEGPTFKYYFTCFLHIATVILQLFVAVQSMQSSLGMELLEAANKAQDDYIRYSVVSFSASFPALDFGYWFDWGNMLVIDGWSFDLDVDFPVDISLIVACKVSYVFGLLALVLEKVVDAFKALFVMVCSGSGVTETDEAADGENMKNKGGQGKKMAQSKGKVAPNGDRSPVAV